MWPTFFQAVLLVASVGADATDVAALPKPIATRQRAFAIPFRVERADHPSREPVEVQLYLSSDRGAHWQLYQRTDPAKGQFAFSASADGEYWFYVRTLDRSGQLRPDAPARPELRVIVDVTPPGMETTGTGTSQEPYVAARGGFGSEPVPVFSDSGAMAPPGPVTAGTHPAIRNQYIPSGENKVAQSVPAFALPPGEKPRMVNARLFELVYDVESVGPSGIARVELWGTTDGGRTWRRFATDETARGRIQAEVEQEGIYGFRLTAQNATGVATQPPRAGDLPEIWVGVDVTKPTVRAAAAVEGPGGQPDSLAISWEASDQMLAARPVTILFSENPGGPWTPLAAGLENTGRYTWMLDNRPPARLYLRVEVRDEAGNVGVHEPGEPILLDRAKPSVRIRDVRPLSQASRSGSGPKTYYFR